jgi:AsmA protein
LKRIAKWVGIFLAVVIAGVVSLPFLVNVNQFKPTLESDLSSALGREAKLGDLRLKILAGEVTADDLSVAEDPAFGKPAFLEAKSLHVGVELWPFLISRKLVVTDLTIDQPEIALVQSPSGDWNFSTLGGKSHTAPATAPSSARMPLDLSVKLVRITNGRLTLRRTVGHWKPLVLEQVNIELQNFSSTSVFPFSLAATVRGGGTLKLNGKAGPIDPADSAMTPVSASLNLAQLDVAQSGMNDVASDVAGLISFDGSGESDGRMMRVKGRLKAEKLKLAKSGTPATRPLVLDFSVQHDLRKHTGVVQQGDIHLGKALARLTGTYAEQGDVMVLGMKLAGPEMPVQELEAMLPAMGVVLPAGASLQGGTASAILSMEGPANRLVTSGSLAVNNMRLTGFDLPTKMASIEKMAGIKGGPDTEIQTLSASVRVAPEGTNAQDIKLIVPAIGDLSGGGTVSADYALDFQMSALVHTSGVMALVRDKPIPFTVGGTCSQPVFRPDVKAVVKEEVKGVAVGLLHGLLGGKKN